MPRRHRNRQPRALALGAVMLLGAALAVEARQSNGRTPSVSVSESALADSFQQKLERVQQNGRLPHPQGVTTVFAEEEINAYFAQRRLKIPDGVQTVRFELAPDEVTAFTRVDFEQIRRDRHYSNPLLSIFDGVHDATVIARSVPAGPGRVRVTVESVTIDDVKVPRMVLQMFVDKYVHPKYPDVGLDNEYRLPVRMDSATIEENRGVIVQK